jgi:hypothetical protein
MLEQRRKPGPIAIAAELRAAIAELRARAGVTAPADLDLDALRDVETAVGMRFGDDVLALLAAGLPQLRGALGWRLEMVVAHTGALRAAGARGDLVGLGRRGSLHYCVEKREVPGPSTELHLHDADERAGSRMPLAAWVERLLAEARAAGGTVDCEADAFRPRLVARVLESTATGRRVRHRVFGEGAVLAESGTGADRKVKAEFPGHGLKHLAARFVEFLD